MNRKQRVLRILELRRKIVEMAGYTAGAEGIEIDPESKIPDSLWERAAKHYDEMLRDEGLVDDVTDDELQELDLQQGGGKD
jgi:hypothetical protein